MATTADKGSTRCPAVAALAARVLCSIVKRNLFQACHGDTGKVLDIPQAYAYHVLGQAARELNGGKISRYPLGLPLA